MRMQHEVCVYETCVYNMRTDECVCGRMPRPTRERKMSTDACVTPYTYTSSYTPDACVRNTCPTPTPTPHPMRTRQHA